MSKCYDNPEYNDTYSDIQNTWNQRKSEKETFEDYLQRLKDRRTEDDYKYTDEDFIKYEEYIRDCCKNGMSVYKCLEFMYFAEKDMDDQLFNRESKQECMITKIMGMDAKMAYDSLPKQETLEEITKSKAFEFKVDYKPFETDLDYREYAEHGFEKGFIDGAKWQQQRSYSEEEVLGILVKAMKDVKVKQLTFFDGGSEYPIYSNLSKWFEQFKKK